jgi:hypothetical protein
MYNNPPTSTLPTIISFTVDNDSIVNGTTITFNWTTANATDLDWNGLNVTGTFGVTANPQDNAIYTLTATNENGTVDSNITINVSQPPPTLPIINSFTVDNNSIINGTTITFNWTTSYATDLDWSGLNVTGTTGVQSSPQSDVIYTLTATNENGSVNSNITINVSQNECLGISSFNADKTMTANCEVSSVTVLGNYKLNCAGYTLNITTSGNGISVGSNNPVFENCVINIPSASNVYAGGAWSNAITFNNTVLNTNSELRPDWQGLGQRFYNVTYLPTTASAFEDGMEVTIVDSQMKLGLSGIWGGTVTITRSNMTYNSASPSYNPYQGNTAYITDSIITITNNGYGIGYFVNCNMTGNTINMPNSSITTDGIICAVDVNGTVDYRGNNVTFDESAGFTLGTVNLPVLGNNFTFENNRFSGNKVRYGISAAATLGPGNFINISSVTKSVMSLVRISGDVSTIDFANSPMVIAIETLFEPAATETFNLGNMAVKLVLNNASYNTFTLNNAEVTELVNFNEVGTSMINLSRVEFSSPVTMNAITKANLVSAFRTVGIDGVPDAVSTAASLMLYNTSYASTSDFIVRKDGAQCTAPTCTNVSVVNQEVRFQVTGFSNYTLSGSCDMFDGTVEAGLYSGMTCTANGQVLNNGVALVAVNLVLSNSTTSGLNITDSQVTMSAVNLSSKPKVTNSNVTSSGNLLTYYSLQAQSNSTINPMTGSNKSVDVTASYNITGYAQAATCLYNMSGLYSTLSSNLSGNTDVCYGSILVPYYELPGYKNVTVTLSDVFGSVSQTYTDVAYVNELTALGYNQTVITFSGSLYGVENKSSEGGITAVNNGNTPVSQLLVTAYNLVGASLPGIILNASYFRAGSDVASSVVLQHGVQKNVTFTAGVQGQALFKLWLNVPLGQYPQTYISQTAWDISPQ